MQSKARGSQKKVTPNVRKVHAFELTDWLKCRYLGFEARFQSQANTKNAILQVNTANWSESRFLGVCPSAAISANLRNRNQPLFTSSIHLLGRQDRRLKNERDGGKGRKRKKKTSSEELSSGFGGSRSANQAYLIRGFRMQSGQSGRGKRREKR